MLDTVLPLVARDLAWFHILQRTMRAFIRIPGTWWVVAPDRDYNLVRAAVAGNRYLVLPESRVAPELASARDVTGWYKQQLLKLAMASHLQSDFYLTLDADVIVARPVEMYDLVVQGRAICHRYAGDNHRRWYRWTQRVLRLRRSGWVHGVTPVMMGREGVRSWPRT